jgi:hypothetical protein
MALYFSGSAIDSAAGGCPLSRVSDRVEPQLGNKTVKRARPESRSCRSTIQMQNTSSSIAVIPKTSTANATGSCSSQVCMISPHVRRPNRTHGRRGQHESLRLLIPYRPCAEDRPSMLSFEQSWSGCPTVCAKALAERSSTLATWIKKALINVTAMPRHR